MQQDALERMEYISREVCPRSHTVLPARADARSPRGILAAGTP